MSNDAATTPTIRLLRVDELSLLDEGGGLFFQEGKMPGGYKPEVFRTTLGNLITKGIAGVMGMFYGGTIQGAIAAIVHPDFFNGEKVATELFWFVLPQYRGRGGLKLLLEFEKWAKEQGCVWVHMVHLVNLQPEKLGALYERMGYERIEVNYVKKLT